MEWDSKMPPWDFPELERDNELTIGSAAGSSGGLGRQASGLACSVDLKLGGLGDFGSSSNWKDQITASATATMVSSSASGPSKKPRAPGNGGQTASCLVEGCKSDLSKCREYHRRHKVCEAHSKTPIVMVGGQEQRFCQQCSRFHLLKEFDEAKRSCRKRLDGHNRRRRKPQPDSVNSSGFFTNYQGSRFSSYPSFPTAIPEPNWTGIIKTEGNPFPPHQEPVHLSDRQHTFPNSFNSYDKGRRRFPFLQDMATLTSRTTLESSVCQPLLKTITASESSSSKMFSDALTPVLDSDCALSLLSSPAQTSGINLSQVVPSADRIPMAQPLVSSLQYDGYTVYSHSKDSNNVSPTGFSCSGLENSHVGTVLVPGANDANFHSQTMFHVGGEGSSDGTSHGLPFSWQ